MRDYYYHDTRKRLPGEDAAEFAFAAAIRRMIGTQTYMVFASAHLEVLS